jgi:hypothetical protein
MSRNPAGRPSKLDPDLDARLAALLTCSAAATDAVRELGVSRRTIAGVARSGVVARSRKCAYVELERMIVRGQIAAAEYRQPRMNRRRKGLRARRFRLALIELRCPVQPSARSDRKTGTWCAD